MLYCIRFYSFQLYFNHPQREIKFYRNCHDLSLLKDPLYMVLAVGRQEVSVVVVLKKPLTENTVAELLFCKEGARGCP